MLAPVLIGITQYSMSSEMRGLLDSRVPTSAAPPEATTTVTDSREVNAPVYGTWLAFSCGVDCPQVTSKAMGRGHTRNSGPSTVTTHPVAAVFATYFTITDHPPATARPARRSIRGVSSSLRVGERFHDRLNDRPHRWQPTPSRMVSRSKMSFAFATRGSSQRFDDIVLKTRSLGARACAR